MDNDSPDWINITAPHKDDLHSPDWTRLRPRRVTLMKEQRILDEDGSRLNSRLKEM